jgi:hypothetical protein
MVALKVRMLEGRMVDSMVVLLAANWDCKWVE